MMDVEKRIEEVMMIIQDYGDSRRDFATISADKELQIIKDKLRTLLSSAQSGEQERWCPDVCPITGRKFFMWLEHWETGKDVPTYGGPYDSYTIPVKDSDGTFSCERFDHDAGEWMTEGMGWECLGLMLCDDQAFVVNPGNPRYDEIREFAENPAPALEVERDAARWRETLKHIGGARCQLYGKPEFVIHYLPPAGNLMQGSVAEHFTKSIDAAIAASQPNGEVA